MRVTAVSTSAQASRPVGGVPKAVSPSRQASNVGATSSSSQAATSGRSDASGAVGSKSVTGNAFQRIEQSAVRIGKQTVVGPPKSASGARTVAIDEETARRLHWHQCRQRMEMLRTTGQKDTPDYVFTTPSGEPLDPALVSRRFDQLVKASGLPRIRLHDLRHTSASIGLASGESLLEVSRRLGHSSITVTADIYSHIAPAVAKESAERLASSVYRARS